MKNVQNNKSELTSIISNTYYKSLLLFFLSFITQYFDILTYFIYHPVEVVGLIIKIIGKKA